MKEPEQFTDELQEIVSKLRKLKNSYPMQWTEVCKRAVVVGEMTLSNAYGASQSAVSLFEEILLEKQLQETSESAEKLRVGRLQTSLKCHALLETAIESLGNI